MASINQAITVSNAGDTLVLTVVNRGVTAGFAATGVTGGGATWYLANTAVNGTSGPGAVDIWVGLDASSGAQTVTITVNGTNTAGCNLDEWQNLNSIPSFPIGYDTSGSTATGNTATPSLTLTPTNLQQLVYVASSSANTETASPTGVFSTLTGPTSSGNQVAGIGYWVTTTLTGTAASWTQTSGQWTVTGVAFSSSFPQGDFVYNATTAGNNAAVIAPQSQPDALDLANDLMGQRGTGVVSGCVVGPNTGSDFNYQVGVGTVFFNGAPVSVSAATAQAITTADGTNPRKDLVYVDNLGSVKYLAGTAATIPCVPSASIWPYVTLAEIDVPASATTFDNGTSTSNAHPVDKRQLINPAITSARAYYTSLTSGTQVIAETIDRMYAGTVGSPLVSGDLYMIAIMVPAGAKIGHITFTSGQTAASTPTHWWFGLYDNNLNQLAITADQTTTAWAAKTVKTLAISGTIESSSATTFTTRYTGLYYLGLMVVASTPPNLVVNSGSTSSSAALQAAPVLGGFSDVSQTTPPTFPHTGTALSNVNGAIVSYAYIST